MKREQKHSNDGGRYESDVGIDREEKDGKEEKKRERTGASRFFRSPPLALGVFVFLLCVASAAFSVVAAANEWTSPFVYLSYAVAAASLAYTVYLLVRLVPRWKKSITKKLKANPFVGELIDDYGYRTGVFAALSTFVNFAYAIFEAVMSLLTLSPWRGALAVYYGVLTAMRLGVTVNNRKERKKAKTQEDYRSYNENKVRVYRFCGILLIVLSAAMAGMVVQMIRDERGFEYAGLTIYAEAAYTFWRVTLSVVNLVKARKFQDPIVQAIRNINLAGATMSLLGLQTAMMAAFSLDKESAAWRTTMNSFSGGLVCGLTLLMGVFMIVNATKKLNDLQRGEEQ